MKFVVRVIILFIVNFVQCTIDGISYLDEFKFKDLLNNFPKPDNPCNPLYWYPKQIPDYCHIPKLPQNVKLEPKPKPPKPATPQVPAPPAIVAPVLPAPMIPLPMLPPPMIPSPMIPSPMIPSPMIPSPIVPSPVPSSVVASHMVPPSMLHSHYIPPSMLPSHMISSPSVSSPLISSPLAYSASLMATNPMVPLIPQHPLTGFQIPQYHHTFRQQNAGMVPGLPGIVTRDGGINILPFSDAYSDILEKHKQKMIRRKLEKVLRRYEDFPRQKLLWRSKKFGKATYDYE